MKFRSAQRKAQYLHEKNELTKLLKKYNIRSDNIKDRMKTTNDNVPSYHRETKYIPSLNAQNMGPCLKQNPKHYTGNLIIGIATMHKSNAVPIINKKQACDIANMRR